MGNLDDYLDKLQDDIFEDARQALGDRGFDRWRNPKFNGKMADADGQACLTGECGDTMEIFLKFKNDRVCRASYFTDGCASSNVAGSFACELSMGRDPDQVADISQNAVLNAIGRLPESDMHCASLASRTVQEALSEYMSKQIKINNE
ncbi:MAG: iron-sulfur cluster assembly scaffold protein [Desulfobacteraceae bacterium]|nr:iron-sulfur cluster assembly scaffold protein [Desulfobacteraceae bacterium]